MGLEKQSDLINQIQHLKKQDMSLFLSLSLHFTYTDTYAHTYTHIYENDRVRKEVFVGKI